MSGGGHTMRKIFIHTYNDIISVDNLLSAWQEFRRDKRNKKDVQLFERNLMDNILELHTSLRNKTYVHSNYFHFKINDPKPRDIHKASVGDRVIHHLLYQSLYKFFDNKFISDSYSCRFGKGTHKGIEKLRKFALKTSKNNTKPCFVLKCDIRKFFANIDHGILKRILHDNIQDYDILNLLSIIIDSFNTQTAKPHFTNGNPWDWVGKGLPLGNLTSQLLVNIYMNEFDQFVKHKLKVKYYIRYADDFVILSEDKKFLEELLPIINSFLDEHLKLNLHPDKVFIQSFASGVDFLGWIHFSYHRVLRTTTKNRMWRRIAEQEYKEETIQSYLGLLSHGNANKITNALKLKYKNKI